MTLVVWALVGVPIAFALASYALNHDWSRAGIALPENMRFLLWLTLFVVSIWSGLLALRPLFQRTSTKIAVSGIYAAGMYLFLPSVGFLGACGNGCAI
jgi:hypothetical protein